MEHVQCNMDIFQISCILFSHIFIKFHVIYIHSQLIFSLTLLTFSLFFAYVIFTYICFTYIQSSVPYIFTYIHMQLI